MSSARPKLLFVLSHDYGELFNAVYFASGAPFDVVFALPPRLHLVNRQALPVTACAYHTAGDVLALVDQYQPDAVLLFSGYLLVINKLFTQPELAGLLKQLRQRGLPLATSDPSLGLIARGSQELFRDPLSAAARLAEHFDWLAATFAEDFHCYLAPGGIEPPRRHGSYFNPRQVFPADELARRAAKLATWSAIVAGQRRWLFILSPEDEAIQTAAHGREAFAKLFAERLRDVERAGRQAVLIAPHACLQAVRAAGAAPANLVSLAGCGYLRFMLLLYDAEYVFYWNQFSASMLGRVIHQLPIFTFAEGHLARTMRGIRELGGGHFFLGREPTRLAMSETLDAEQLARLAAAQRDELLVPVSQYLAQSPAPEQLVATAFHGIH